GLRSGSAPHARRERDREPSEDGEGRLLGGPLRRAEAPDAGDRGPRPAGRVPHEPARPQERPRHAEPVAAGGNAHLRGPRSPRPERLPRADRGGGRRLPDRWHGRAHGVPAPAYPIAGMDGRTVYLRDVAEVLDAPREQRSLYRFNGREAVEVSIVQQPEASSVRVIDDVKAKLAEIQRDFPSLRFEVAYDNSAFVGYLMDNMFEELGTAVLLTGLVVLLFLGNVRGTLIALITLPMSLGIALLAMVPLGMTLNSSTLIGLLLSVGRLVDDSIIDVHSIERHLRMGKSPKEAA